MAKGSANFPWLTGSAGFLCVAYLFVDSDEYLRQLIPVLDTTPQQTIKLGMLVVLLLLMLLDRRHFRNRQENVRTLLANYKTQVDDLLKTNGQLQNKAQQFSGHANKLKLFISDRLLEYIEYDEKFLHFKNIASEVRHNGVICYDKVTSSLKQAIAEARDPHRQAHYEEAMESMVYLWDLLDLSTTDNISLYVANKLYECEEIYYRSLLQEEAKAGPYVPTFSMHNAVKKALRNVIDDGALPPLTPGNSTDPVHFRNSTVALSLAATGRLLGNENYMVLLIENMINNGLYYAEDSRFGNPFAHLEINLKQVGKDAVLTIYNLGPHIDESDREKIYQLGYTTKKNRANNGKGLGLYFVKQIVTGYEGSIDFENVHNSPDTYVMRLDYGKGEIHNAIIETARDKNGKPCCRKGEELLEAMALALSGKLESLEVSIQSLQRTVKFDANQLAAQGRLTDPVHPANPRWCISIDRRNDQLEFQPLDVNGVMFTIVLPTAEARFSGGDAVESTESGSGDGAKNPF